MYNSPFYRIVANTSNIFYGAEYRRILFSYEPRKSYEITGYSDMKMFRFDESNILPDINANFEIKFLVKFIIINLFCNFN